MKFSPVCISHFSRHIPVCACAYACASHWAAHEAPKKEMRWHRKYRDTAWSTACIFYRLNNKTGDALFTHYSCQVNYHIQKFIDIGNK